jgi:hypothetical protein
MSKPQPWRDIPSASKVKSLLGLGAPVQVAAPAGRPGAPPYSLRRFCDNVADYHRIPKDSLAKMRTRASMLQVIGNMGRELLANNHAIRNSGSGISAALAMVSDRALNKARYVKTIYDFYMGEGSGVFKGADLLNYLRSPPTPGGTLRHLVPGCRMEMLDPFHRSVELDLNPQHGFTLLEFQSGMGYAFAQWCGILIQHPHGEPGDLTVVPEFTFDSIDSSRLPPFFLWLENHAICSGDDNTAFGGMYAFTPETVTGVLYSPYGSRPHTARNPIAAVHGIHWIMPSSDGIVAEMPLDNPAQGLRPFDTQHLPGKGHEEAQSAAYVWTQCGTLLAGEHATGELHHSSFVGGHAVRCAGMIRVAGGKVDMISSNSGHYRPSEDNLRSFAKWLQSRGVFTPFATARFFRNDAIVEEDILTFLGLTTSSGRMPSDHVKAALLDLKQRVGRAVERYKQSGTQVKAFSFMRNVTRSRESLDALEYLEKDFPGDIDTAILVTTDSSWWMVPCEVIRSLLQETDAKPFPSLLADSTKVSPVIGRNVRPFSARITRLRPLKNPSTMRTILLEEWRSWKPPMRSHQLPRTRGR